MSDAFEAVLGPLVNVRAQVGKVLADHGLALNVFAVLPGAGVEGPHEVQLVATLGDGEPPRVDEDFERVVGEAREAEVRARADDARNELHEHLKGSGGFLT